METELTQEIELLESLINDASSLLLSPREVSERLNAIASKLFAKRLLVEIVQHGQKYRWGALDDAAPTTILRKGSLSSTVDFEVRGDNHAVTGPEQRFLPKFLELAKTLWGNDIRSMGGPNWKPEAVQSRLAQSAERLRGESNSTEAIAVLFGDLDNFKALNDQAGHERGDEAIQLVNRELHDLCLRHGGLPFHPSGDEFYLILPDRGLLPMMQALFGLKQRIEAQPFKDDKGIEHKVGLTLGLKFLYGSLSVDNLKSALVEAEAATKYTLKSEKLKRRGKLSISGTNNAAATSIDAEEFGKLAALLARRNALTAPAVFRDPRLGMIQSVVRSFQSNSRQTFQEHLHSVLNWLDIEPAASCTVESLLLDTAPKAIPKIALAVAIASGILQARADVGGVKPVDLRIRFSKDGNRASVIEGGKIVVGDQLSSGVASVYEVEIDAPNSGRKPCVLVGVQVGLQDQLKLAGGNPLPSELFTHVVVVDDRPNSGGGLPDFWQAALAQICAIASVGPDPVHVFAWGKTSSHSETVLRLCGPADWPDDEIAYLADIASKKVRSLQPQLRSNTQLVVDAATVVNALYSIAPVMHPASKSGLPLEPSDNGSPQRAMLQVQPLQPTDGLRCRTAAQAYPIIIDTLRKSQTRPSSDDAHQPLRELVAFKLTLETPSLFTVPTYLRNQEADMARYADGVLLSESGRIRKGLDSKKQVKAFKKELLACFAAGEVPRSTRRACLVVPHVPTPDGNPSPEGLVSVWASPRMVESAERTVDWVFVWRTVEAFIGLPYSLYGSIKFAQSLMSQLNEGLPKSTSTPFRLGELTYIALSLHMRSDGVHRRIAKRIVDESSE
ncbi:diguanylate cyclase (GGDEF)-like protein [Acidovorax delafieldii]|uniref:diguanylate cyclase n=1 Tax=Acidovorax delafieldii TaxID=47920 RepID=UPI00286442DE|nr:diguanylate cyclase [Acidovorax delafieldii]MDR6154166.1 diguanylate cyclase (GGDEF)-like protein [Acidovorax delafieldii]